MMLIIKARKLGYGSSYNYVKSVYYGIKCNRSSGCKIRFAREEHATWFLLNL